MTNVDDLVLVNALMRQALVAIEEVMGQKGLNAVLRTSHLDQYIDHLPPDDLNPAINASDYARLNQAIEEFYGRGGRGILQRIGKASFEYAIREQSTSIWPRGRGAEGVVYQSADSFRADAHGGYGQESESAVAGGCGRDRGRLCLCGPHLFAVLWAAQR